MSKIDSISSFLATSFYQYKNDLDEKSIDIVYRFYSDHVLDQRSSLNCICVRYIALYYSVQYEKSHLPEDEFLMQKYLQISVEGGDIISMQYLGGYYYSKGNYDYMIKYWLMAVNGGDVEAMYNLALYYKEQNDTENMLKYYILAAEHGNLCAVNNLIVYYGDCGDDDNMYKYYAMAADYGDIDALHLVSHYYHRMEDYPKMMKYLLMITDFSDNHFLIYDKLMDCTNNRLVIPFLIRQYQSLKSKEKQIKILTDQIKNLTTNL